MANYTFLDASASVQTAASSVIGGVNYPIVKIPDVINVSINTGSVLGISVTGSILGTQTEDAPASSGAPGLFGLSVRNDTLSSVTSTDGDYSAQSVGPSGEVITANAPLTKWVQGTASVLSGGGPLTTIIPAQGASVFTYITSGQVANASGNNVYLTMFGATSSVIGYIPLPANSGALPLMPNGWKTNANGAFSASVSGVASVFLSFQGFISKI